MTTFVHDQEFIQPVGDPASLSAPFSSPNYVFLTNTGAEGFAGQNGSTDYIVLGNANVYGSNPGGGIAWQPGDEIQITFQIFTPAASFTVASDPAIHWTQGPAPPWTGSGALTWTATLIMGTTNEWFSFTGQGISGLNSNINFSIDFEFLGNDSNPADEDTGDDNFKKIPPIIPPPEPPPPPREVSFLGPNGGDFGNPAYWTGGVLPGATVAININGVAVFSSGNYTVNTVTTNTSGTLVINGGTFAAGSYVLNYGTIIITVPYAALMAPSAFNYGTMRAIGGLIDFDPLQNFGTMSADSGGEIAVTDDTMNAGAIYANAGGTVYLGGQVWTNGPAFPGVSSTSTAACWYWAAPTASRSNSRAADN
jgi:hypothetical protein